jgi:hypothetical protein
VILALHIAAINGHPYSIDARGYEGSELVCQIGPALVKPDGWRIPEGMPRTHRQCVNWGIPMRELLAAVLRMSEIANVFVAHSFADLDANMKAWSAGDKALAARLDPWTRPGPERVDVVPIAGEVLPQNAGDVLALYFKMRETGIAA